MPKPYDPNNEFYRLRMRAQENRDKKIATAKREYEVTLIAIARLEADLIGNQGTQHTTGNAAVMSLMPRDSEFSILDLMALLETHYPNRIWNVKTVRTYMGKLAKKKILRRTRRAKNDAPALYVLADAKIPTRKFEGMTLLEVIEVLLTKPMNQTELVVHLMENGYETGMRKDLLRTRVGYLLRKNPQFRKGDKNRWSKIG